MKVPHPVQVMRPGDVGWITIDLPLDSHHGLGH